MAAIDRVFIGSSTTTNFRIFRSSDVADPTRWKWFESTSLNIWIYVVGGGLGGPTKKRVSDA